MESDDEDLVGAFKHAAPSIIRVAPTPTPMCLLFFTLRIPFLQIYFAAEKLYLTLRSERSRNTCGVAPTKARTYEQFSS